MLTRRRPSHRQALALAAVVVGIVPVLPVLPDPGDGSADQGECAPGAGDGGLGVPAPDGPAPAGDVPCTDEVPDTGTPDHGADEPSPSDDAGVAPGDDRSPVAPEESADGDTDQAGEDDGDDGDETSALSPGLRALDYAGIYAPGVPLWAVVATTRHLIDVGAASPSPIPVVSDAVWNGFGGHARFDDAPRDVQDQFLFEVMATLVEEHAANTGAIPVAWYHPAALADAASMDVVPDWVGDKGPTVAEYQMRWLKVFDEQLLAGAPVQLPPDPDPLAPSIAFPVLGPTTFWDDWHAPRDDGARRHEGLDFMGAAGQPLRAAFDGVVTRLRPDDTGLAGVGITLTRADGLRANYFHLDAELRWHPSLDVGDRVRAGQVIAFMGATGNAWDPHLHFELRTPEGEPMAPYPSTQDAVQREQCTVGIGPWSTMFESPAEIVERIELEAETAGAPLVDADVPLVDVAFREVAGPDGARWTITGDGAVTASGSAAVVAPIQGACSVVPVDEYGTGAAGFSVDLLPDSWWGDEVDPSDLEAMIAAVAGERSQEFDVDLLVDAEIWVGTDPMAPRISSVGPRFGNTTILGSVIRPVPSDDTSSD